MELWRKDKEVWRVGCECVQDGLGCQCFPLGEAIRGKGSGIAWCLRRWCYWRKILPLLRFSGCLLRTSSFLYTPIISQVFTPLRVLCLLSGVPSPLKALLETLNLTCSEEIAQESEDTWSRLSFVHLKKLHLFVNLCALIYMCVSRCRCRSLQVTFKKKLLASAVWNSVVERRSAILGTKHRFHWVISMAHSFARFFIVCK